MTEHAAVVFVFFFLAEYASIALICILTTLLFLGGYLLDFSLVFILIKNTYCEFMLRPAIEFMSTPLVEGMLYGITLGLKTCIMIFIFI